MQDGGNRDGGLHTAKAVVLIVVLAIIGIAVLSKTGGKSNAIAASHHTTTTVSVPSSAPAPTTTTVAAIAPSQVKVQVLNGVLTGSLAGAWTTKLRASPGYQTETPDNATAKVTASAIYILTPGYVAEADQLAAAVGLPVSAVNTTVPPPSTAPIPASERATANLVLVVGPDLAATA